MKKVVKNFQHKHDLIKNGNKNKNRAKNKLIILFHRQRYKNLRGKSLKKSRTWIMEKKERWRNKGRHVINQKIIQFIIFFILEMFDPIQNIQHENDQKLFEHFFCFVCHQYCCFNKKKKIIRFI